MVGDADVAEEDSAGPSFAYEYIVKPGDSLASIAAAFARAGIITSIEQITQANDLQASHLKVGQRLLVPMSEAPSAAFGDERVFR
jgi:LysM repeat protein